MQLRDDRNGIVPIIIALYGLLAVAMALAWIYVIGAFAVGLGFTVAGIVAFARKKWLSGVICLIIAVASVVLVWAILSGEITLDL